MEVTNVGEKDSSEENKNYLQNAVAVTVFDKTMTFRMDCSQLGVGEAVERNASAPNQDLQGR